MPKVAVKICAQCQESLPKGSRKNKIYCSDLCREKTRQEKSIQTRIRGESLGGATMMRGEDSVDSELPTDLNLIKSHPHFSRVDFKNRVLCPICWEPTRHEPIILDEVPDSNGIAHVIPVYHAECYRQRERTNGKY